MHGITRTARACRLRWHHRRVPQTQRAWLLVVPIATIGILVGHQLAYAVTGTPTGGLHGYLAHAPQVALVLSALSFLGASFVTRGARLALWPFPAVAVIGFVAQEHVERLRHSGSLPFLLDRPVFLVGILIQCIVALVVWYVARSLLCALHADRARERLRSTWSFLVGLRSSVPAPARITETARPRAPPSLS